MPVLAVMTSDQAAVSNVARGCSAMWQYLCDYVHLIQSTLSFACEIGHAIDNWWVLNCTERGVMGWRHQLLPLELYLLIVPQPLLTHSYVRANKPSWYDNKNQGVNSKERLCKCYDSDALLFCNSVNIANHGACWLRVNYKRFHFPFVISLFSLLVLHFISTCFTNTT